MSHSNRTPGWLVSVKTDERVELYAVGTRDFISVIRVLTDGEIDRHELKQGEVKPFAYTP